MPSLRQTKVKPFSRGKDGVALEKEKSNRIVVVLLVLLLLTGLISQLTNLSTAKELKKLREMQAQLLSSNSGLQSEISQVYQAFQAMEEQGRWWEPEMVEMVAVDPGTATFRVSWFLKNYREGSRVFLNYRRQGDKDFMVVEGEAGAAGHFQAFLDLEFVPEPSWSFAVSYPPQVRQGGAWIEKAEEKSVDVDGHFAPPYEYYISTSEEGDVRASELKTLSDEKCLGSYYSLLESNFDLEETRIFGHLSEWGEPRYKVSSAHLELYRGGQFVRKVPLKKERQEDLVIWQVEEKAEAGKDYKTLRLVLTFSDGKTFFKEF